MADEIVIPDKPAFKAAEVCELLKLQPYVLKSWENEFKDLGVSKSAGGPRVYRRVDVERAVRIRELMLREGLTLAGVRRRLEQETVTSDAEDALIAEIAAAGAAASPPVNAVDRERVAQVRHGLRALLDTLSRPAPAAPATPPADAVLSGPRPRARRRAAAGTEERQAPPGPAPLVVQQPAPDVAPPAHAATARPSPPARELTVVVEEAPGLFSEDDSEAVRETQTPATPAVKRKRPSRLPEPHAE